MNTDTVYIPLFFFYFLFLFQTVVKLVDLYCFRNLGKERKLYYVIICKFYIGFTTFIYYLHLNFDHFRIIYANHPDQRVSFRLFTKGKELL